MGMVPAMPTVNRFFDAGFRFKETTSSEGPDGWDGLQTWAAEVCQRHDKLTEFFASKSIKPTELEAYRKFVADSLMEAASLFVLTGKFRRPPTPGETPAPNPDAGFTVSGNAPKGGLVNAPFRALDLARQAGFNLDQDPE
jgi:hypothetical protein